MSLLLVLVISAYITLIRLHWLLVAPEGTYKNGIRSVFAEIMRESGPKGLFKGLTPVLVRAFPANAVSIRVFVHFKL